MMISLNSPNFPCLQGLVLAGGKSSRMGQNKALLYLGNVRFVDKAAALLKTLTCRTLISCANDSDFPEYECVIDAVPGNGPAQGILAGLKNAENHGCNGILALACDLPLMGAEPLEYLIKCHAARPNDKLVSLYFSSKSGKAEMLAAIYNIAFIEPLEQGLALGEKSLYRLLPKKWANHIPLPAQWESMFLNCNTPQDLQIIESRWHEDGSQGQLHF